MTDARGPAQIAEALEARAKDSDTYAARWRENDFLNRPDVADSNESDAALLRAAAAKIREMELALMPFAREYETFDCVVCDGVEMLPDDHTFGITGEWPPIHSPMETGFTFGDLRAARSALSARGED